MGDPEISTRTEIDEDRLIYDLDGSTIAEVIVGALMF